MPILLAVGGWLLQDTVSRRSVSHQYVSLAVSILKEPIAEVTLRDWAVDILNEHSPVSFDPETSQRLKSGELSLPTDRLIGTWYDLSGLIQSAIMLCETARLASIPSSAERRRLDRLIFKLKVGQWRTESEILEIPHVQKGQPKIVVTENEATLLNFLRWHVDSREKGDRHLCF